MNQFRRTLAFSFFMLMSFFSSQQAVAFSWQSIYNTAKENPIKTAACIGLAGYASWYLYQWINNRPMVVSTATSPTSNSLDAQPIPASAANCLRIKCERRADGFRITMTGISSLSGFTVQTKEELSEELDPQLDFHLQLGAISESYRQSIKQSIIDHFEQFEQYGYDERRITW